MATISPQPRLQLLLPVVVVVTGLRPAKIQAYNHRFFNSVFTGNGYLGKLNTEA